MAQFDVYTNVNTQTKERVPYLLDIQHDLLDDLSTRVVIPLVVGMKPVTHLNLLFVIDGQKVTLSTAEMAGVPLRLLGAKVTSLEQSRQEIIAAVDFLITGF
jgi:toxin CcdB